MSKSDKTRQKLMESMRRTKAGSKTGNKDKPAKSQTAGVTSTTKSTKKPPTKAKKKTVKTAAYQNDPYQYGQRVWPD
jgi:hypothetical protein